MIRNIRLIRCLVSYNVRDLERGTSDRKVINVMIPDTVTVFTPSLLHAAKKQVCRHEKGAPIDITNVKLAHFSGTQVVA